MNALQRANIHRFEANLHHVPDMYAWIIRSYTNRNDFHCTAQTINRVADLWLSDADENDDGGASAITRKLNRFHIEKAVMFPPIFRYKA